MKYLITGGEGFIGRNLKEELENHNHEVWTLDIAGSPDFSLSVTDYGDILKATTELDGIFHLAAVTSPPEFEADLFKGFDTNVVGTLNVLKAASENGVKRVVLASSSAVYGDINIPGKEDMVIPGHENMYATTKLFDEYLGRHFTIRKDLEAVSLRFFNTYGLNENSKGMYSSVISKFLDSMVNGSKPLVFGDGTQRRDFVYVKDVAKATYSAMINGAPGESYNVGTGISSTFNSIVSTIGKVLGREIEYSYEKNPFRSYQMFTQADVVKSTKELKWKANYSLVDGIREMASNIGLL